jgi:hypothetical protein
MEKAKRRWLWELNGSWQFETSADGTIPYFPRGWGCGYLVPTDADGRETFQRRELRARSKCKNSTRGLRSSRVDDRHGRLSHYFRTPDFFAGC